MTTRADIDVLKSAAVRDQVRSAGYNPDSKSGDRLVSWSFSQSEDARIPTIDEITQQAAKWDLPVEPVVRDPAAIEAEIAEAREQGQFGATAEERRRGWFRASQLQRAIDRVRNAPGPTSLSAEEEKAIEEAREAGDYARASGLQLQAERRMNGFGVQGPPEPHPTLQPSGGLSAEQTALLEDEDKPVAERLAEAQAAGDYVVSSLLQTRLEREQRGTVRA